MDKQNRVRLAQLPAAVDHFLAAAFHFRVIALYRGKIEIRVGLAGCHRRGCPAAQADIHRRAAEDNQFRPNGNFAFLHVLAADVTNTARQHDRLVVPAQLFAIVAGHFFFIGTEIAIQRRTTEFVVKRGAAQRAVGHDIQRGHNALRLTEIFFPRLFKAGNPQVRDRETDQTGFRFRAATGCPFIADFTAGAGRRTRPGRDGRRVVVRFHFHQDMGVFLMVVIAAFFAIGEEAPYLRTFHDRGVVFIGGQDVVRGLLKGVFDHLKQRLRLLFAIDDPVGVKNLVAAVLGVRLGEHIQFDVVRVTTKLVKRILQIVDFVFRQRQPQTEVGVNQRLTSLPQQIDAGHRRRLMLSKQLFALFQRVKDAFHHPVMEFTRDSRPLFFAQRTGFHIVRHAAFKTHYLRQAAVMGNIGSFRRPGGDGARAGGDEQ